MALPISTTKQWDTLATATLDQHETKLVDAITKDILLLNKYESGGMVESREGGELISYPVMAGRNTTFMRMASDFQELDTAPQEGFSRSFWPWAYYNIAISISRIERNINMGSSTKLLDLLRIKTEQARKTVRDEFHLDLVLGDGTNNGVLGLKELLESTGTVGSILTTEVNSEGNKFWEPQSITSGVTKTNLEEQMEILYNDLIEENSEPDLILMARGVFEAYADKLQSNGQYIIASGGTPKLGFGFKGRELEFKGIPVVWDRRMEANKIYFLNTEYLHLIFHPDGKFNLGEMTTLTKQHASVAHLFTMAQHICSNRRAQGFITTINLGA